ncbi:MAG: hypothetical protein LAQ69_49680 [Acidobacteriia bacterium]|nr:hypothetical protein [Terriglobia bacterium]
MHRLHDKGEEVKRERWDAGLPIRSIGRKAGLPEPEAAPGRFTVSEAHAAAGGTATATLIAVDQGNLEIPVSTVTIKDKQLQLEARAVSGTYRGTLGESGDIAGEWSQGPTRVPLTFKRASEAKKP